MKYFFLGLFFLSSVASAEQLTCVGRDGEDAEVVVEAFFSSDFKEISNIDFTLRRTDPGNRFSVSARFSPAEFKVKKNHSLRLAGELDIEEDEKDVVLVTATYDRKQGVYRGIGSLKSTKETEPAELPITCRLE
ncbi:MAG: hypothetical protein AB7K68_00120 [Bacteriovoracia bacterium]